MKKNYLLVTLIAIGLTITVIGLIFWLKPNNHARSVSESVPATTQGNAQKGITGQQKLPTPVLNSPVAPAEALAASLQDTEIDCALEATLTGELVLNINLRYCFEYFLTQMGEKSLSAIDQQIKQHVITILPAVAAAQATDLWQRYLKYREAEGNLQNSGSNTDPEHLQRVMDQLTQLRQRYFNPLELNALFGEEMTYNQYTIDRLSILDDKSLSAAQKAQQLKQRMAQLPPELQKSLEDIGKLQDLRALTQQLKQNNGSKAELQQMREQLVGPEAAQRLDQLDQTRASWQNRVQNYLGQRQAILTSNQADEDKQQAIIALRERQFSSEAERQRAITYEHFKDQGININELLQ
jgi:lipase chaperone LimK